MLLCFFCFIDAVITVFFIHSEVLQFWFSEGEHGVLNVTSRNNHLVSE